MQAFFVPGTPIPKGSTKSFARGRRVITTNANDKTKPWQECVAEWAAADLVGRGLAAPVHSKDIQVELWLWFVMPRNKTEPKATRPHTRKPDTDKLVRCVMDALTGLAYADDSQVTQFGHVSKRTAEIGEQEGVYLAYAACGYAGDLTLHTPTLPTLAQRALAQVTK